MAAYSCSNVIFRDPQILDSGRRKACNENCVNGARYWVAVVHCCSCRPGNCRPAGRCGRRSPGAELERFAAAELAGQFKQLFDADVKISDKVPAQSTHLILIGSVDTNPAIAGLGVQLPNFRTRDTCCATQVLAKTAALVVGGGSPVATLWAVYELGQRLGIRYMLFGDLYPVTKPELKLDKFDVVLEPTLRDCARGGRSTIFRSGLSRGDWPSRKRCSSNWPSSNSIG